MIIRSTKRNELGRATQELKDLLQEDPKQVAISIVYYSEELKIYRVIYRGNVGLYILYKDYTIAHYYDEITESGCTEFYIYKGLIEQDIFDENNGPELSVEYILHNYIGASEEVIGIVKEHENDDLPY